jgi:hypothetical protein
MKRIFVSLFVISLATSYSALAQNNEPPAEVKKEEKKPIEELRLNLNGDGSHFIKATFLNQTWFRYADYNAGTTVLSSPTSNGFDIGLRRTRFQLYGQLTDHVTFYFQLGQNNFNFLSGNGGAADNNSPYVNRKTQFFIHDALADYRIKKGSDLLFIGGGLTITNGLSRFSQPSIGTIMSLDVPVFAQATVDQTDEFSRKLSLFARGQLGKLDYRLVLTDPFPVNTNGTVSAPLAAAPNSQNATFAQIGHNKQYQGFFMWNFFDKESHVTPYMTGTYLGKKKVLNLEGGFITQKNATWTGDGTVAGTQYHNMNLWSIAMFYDSPINKEKGTAINAYVGYFHTDYGQGYLRYNGTMNPANGNTTPGALANSQGNAFPMFGTGNVIYAQAGYLLKKDLLGEGNGSLMPYVTLQSAKYDRLDKQMNVWDFGLNWFIKGHTSKITLDYQIRPTYSINGSALNRDASMKSQAIIQYQFYF